MQGPHAWTPGLSPVRLCVVHTRSRENEGPENCARHKYRNTVRCTVQLVFEVVVDVRSKHEEIADRGNYADHHAKLRNV